MLISPNQVVACMDNESINCILVLALLHQQTSTELAHPHKMMMMCMMVVVMVSCKTAEN